MTITMRRAATLATLACLLPVGAQAQGGATGSDARCLAAMSMLHDQAKAGDKPALESSMMFFLGKIVGRGGAAAVAPALERAAAGMTAQAAAGIADACADEMGEATNAM